MPPHAIDPATRRCAARLAVVLATLLALCLAGAAPAGAFTFAEEHEYKDAPIESCCSGEVMESGAIEQEYALVSNEGTVTWGAPGTYPVNWGTEGQEGQGKTNFGEQIPDSFEVPDWPRAERPILGTSTEVRHGFSYKFVWDVRAPTVASEEHFITRWAAVADNRLTPEHMSGWMDKDTGLGFNLNLGFTVKPWVQPVLRASGPSQAVPSGGQFTIEANATAVASVNHITFEYDGHTIEAVRPRDPAIAFGQQAEWSASETFTLAEPARTVTVTAYDDSGRGSVPAVVTIAKPAVVNPPVEEPKGKPKPTEEPGKGPITKPGVLPEFGGVMFFPGSGSGRTRLVLKKLVVTKLLSNEQVEIVCGGCRGTHELGPVTAHAGSVTFQPRRFAVTPGAHVIAYVSEPGFDGRYYSYVFNVPKRHYKHPSKGCTTAGTQTHVTCP